MKRIVIARALSMSELECRINDLAACGYGLKGDLQYRGGLWFIVMELAF